MQYQQISLRCTSMNLMTIDGIGDRADKFQFKQKKASRGAEICGDAILSIGGQDGKQHRGEHSCAMQAASGGRFLRANSGCYIAIIPLLVWENSLSNTWL